MGIHGSKPQPHGLPDLLRLAAGNAPFGVSIVDHRIELTEGGHDDGAILRVVSRQRTEEGGHNMGPDVEVGECEAPPTFIHHDLEDDDIDEFEAHRLMIEALAEDERPRTKSIATERVPLHRMLQAEARVRTIAFFEGRRKSVERHARTA